ncbi:caspase family protein [Archangium lipolyticum]|uniref:caspase family protein n=1 Tax=Archangium lipolyticum TaxID=2970465 RepID=UPI00214A1974|nr:caspase family protein [Archangium lipolyticum]
MNSLIALSLVALTAATPTLPDSASVKRLAVVVGANRAAPGRTPLRFAYQDAHALASVLVDAGQFSSEDIVVLEDPDPSRVLAELDARLARLGAARGEGMLLFYYSGHSDERALYPNGQPLELKALRTRLEDGRAAVRIGILDACQGGSWTRAKGLKAAEPFAVEMPMGLTSEGSVLLASSTGQEASHETDALRGSFFTHHLVAGLRGAADQGADGQVTVGEAFAYARRLTIRDTAMLGEAVQHPSFDMKLRGRQDLPLTQLASAGSAIEVRQQTGPLQVIQLQTGLVVLESPEGQRALRLALPVGSYLVRRKSPEGTFAREVEVKPGQVVTVHEENLELVGAPELATKRFSKPLAATLTTLPAGNHAVSLGVYVSYMGSGPWGRTIDRFEPLLMPTWRVGLTDRLELTALDLPAFGLSSERPRVNLPTLRLAYRLGEAGRFEFVPRVGVQPYTLTPNHWPTFLALRASLDTRWWLSGSSSLHVGLGAAHPIPVHWDTVDPDSTLLTHEGLSVNVGYSITLAETVTLGAGVSVQHRPTRVPDGYVLPPGVDRDQIARGGLQVTLGGTATGFPLVSVHINERWSVTADASVGITSSAVYNSYSAGVLAIF